MNGPQIPEFYDLNDFIDQTCLPTSSLVTVTVNTDGTASFALPRSENGQGIMTSTAMIIAEELELPVSKVKVTLADARPELLFNQLTGGSSTTTSTYTPIRVAAAVAKGALLEAAAILLGAQVSELIAKGGVIQAPGGGSATYGQLAKAAAAKRGRTVEVTLKDASAFRVVGVGQNRLDALDAVTGKKTFTTDLRGQGRTADDGLPGAHAQRHPEAAAQPRRRCPGCPASTTSRSSTPASRCGPTPSDSASTRSGRCGSSGRPGRSPGCPTGTSRPS